MKRTKSNFEQMQIEHMEINYFVNFCKINKLFIYFALLFSFRYILSMQNEIIAMGFIFKKNIAVI